MAIMLWGKLLFYGFTCDDTNTKFHSSPVTADSEWGRGALVMLGLVLGSFLKNSAGPEGNQCQEPLIL